MEIATRGGFVLGQGILSQILHLTWTQRRKAHMSMSLNPGALKKAEPDLMVSWMFITQRMRHCQYQCYHICMYVIICVTKCIYELLMYIYSSFVYCICNMWVSTHPHDSPCACCAKLPKGPPAICVKSKVPSLFCFITCWRMKNKIAFVKVVLYLSLHI